MPRISAPTVVEHRAAQRAALLRAAEQILLEAGLAAVTPRSVAGRAGLARSSFYEYFPSRDDVLAAVAVESFDRWATEVAAALDAAPREDRLRVYVEATMRMAGDGRHDIAATLQQADLAPSRYADLMTMHDKLLAPLTTVLREMGVGDDAAHIALTQGLLNTGVQLVTHGADPGTVAGAVVGLLLHGLPQGSTG